MRMYEFEGLAENVKLDLLKEQGVYIGKVKSMGTISILYQVESFYVEVTYEKYRHSVAGIRTFDSTDKIDKYIRQIDLEFLNQPLQ